MSVDLGYLFQSVIGIIKKVFDLSFYCWGIEINIGAMFLFALCAGLLLWFLRKMGE